MWSANILLFLILVCFSSVKSSLLLSDFDLPWNRIDECKNTCDKTYDASSPENGSCARGCRFYSMAEMIARTTSLDPSIGLKACISSCQDSYPSDDSDKKACLSGCDSMSKLKNEPPQEMALTSSGFSFSFYFDDGNGLKSLQSDQDVLSSDENKGADLEPDDVLTDPALRGQAEIGFLNDVKLPVMKFKTLPVEEEVEEDKDSSRSSPCWWWPSSGIDCSCIPPCAFIALIFLLMIVLFKLFLCYCAFKTSKTIFGEDGALVSDCASTKYALFVPENDDSFLVKIPPPKYDEVVVFESDSVGSANEKKSTIDI